MQNPRTVEQLIEELEEQAYYHGRYKALYDHAPGLNVIKQRQEMLRAEALRKQIKRELLYKLKGA